MTITTDELPFNDAADQGDFTGGTLGDSSGFDSPTTNDTNSSPSIYREGTACQGWILKENITGGYTYTNQINNGASGAKDISGGGVVVWWFFITADADLDKLTEFDLQLSSDTGFTTNNARWDAAQQIYDLDFYGWYPVVVYPSNPDHVTGTIVYSSIDSIGWYASTGAAGTKLSGFDNCHYISYLGGHSQAVTLTDLYNQAITDDLGVVMKFDAFFRFLVNIRLGGGTTTNMTFTETGRQLLFANLQTDHELGFIFVDNTTGTNTFELNGWSVSWSSQLATHNIFTDANNCDNFKIDGSTFTNGGQAVLPAYSTSRWVKTTKFDNCGPVDIGDGTFENNPVTNATLGVIYIGSTDTRRAKNTSYTNNTTAIEFDTVGNYTLDGDLFSGNTYDIENSDNAATITAGSFVVGRAYKILTVGTTDFTLIGSADNVIGTKFVATGVGTGTGTATEVLLIQKVGGANPVSVNNTGTAADTLIVASFTLTLAGLASGVAVTIVNSTTRVELKHEVLTGTSTTYVHGGGETVDILINSLVYDPNLSDVYDRTLPNTDSTINFQLLDDGNYVNPT